MRKLVLFRRTTFGSNVATRLLIIFALSSALLALSPLPHALCQIPQGFNYQAIARDGSGNPISTPINVKIAILTSESDLDVIWEEEHTSVDPDDHGLFSIVVGKGTTLPGGLASFNLIDWTETPLYIRTKINDVKLGIAQLWSVPYSMVSGDLGGSVKKLEVMGEDETSDEALFEVKRKDGELMFGVYNHGVRINMPLDTLSKTRKGGFVISGFDSGKDIVQDYFVVNPDSIRVYIDTNPIKTRKGGFAVAGFEAGKQTPEEYLKVTRDSTRIYLNDTGTKTRKGGFAVGGFDQAKQVIQDYMLVSPDSVRIFVKDTTYVKTRKGGFAIASFTNNKGTEIPFTSLTPANYFIGHRSGIRNTTGLHNSFVGFETGQNNTKGSENVFLGYQAGYSNDLGNYNVFLGYQAGYSTNSNYNVFLGYQAGLSNTVGDFNTFIGFEAGIQNTNGRYNVFLGHDAGFSNSTGNCNTFIGFDAGLCNKTGFGNVFIGNECGSWNTYGKQNIFIGPSCGGENETGSYNTFMGINAGFKNNADYNTFLGYSAGMLNTTGTNNIFIGTDSGLGNTTGSNNVILGNSSGVFAKTGTNNSFIGYCSGYKNYSSNNVFIGAYTGYNNSSGYNNTFLGVNSGYNNKGKYNIFLGYLSGYNEIGSERLYIEPSLADSTGALIWGNFKDNILRFNGKVGIGTNPTTNFAIAGLVGSSTGSTLIISGNDVYYLSSKRSSKENIQPLTDSFEKILNTQPVSFKDKATGYQGIGYIAEDFEKEGLQNLLVYENGELVSLRYDLISVYAIEVIKTQRCQIESFKSENDNLKSQLQSLQQEVEQIKALLATSGGK